MIARLAHFSNNDAEYVVIITDDADPEDHCSPGYRLGAVVEIGDAKLFTQFPCDRPLESK